MPDNDRYRFIFSWDKAVYIPFLYRHNLKGVGCYIFYFKMCIDGIFLWHSCNEFQTESSLNTFHKTKFNFVAIMFNLFS